MSVERSFEESRRSFHPEIPTALRDISNLVLVRDHQTVIDDGIRSLLSHLEDDWVYRLVFQKNGLIKSPLRIGVVFSGGPAPGGHSVVAGLFDALSEWHSECRLIGFLGGFKGLLNGSSFELEKKDIDQVRNTGGFSLLGTGRSKIEGEESVSKVISVIREHRLDALVCIGGDDSNTDAAFLAEALRQNGESTCVIGVPKTIDGDLQCPDIPISFGFDTACKVYSATIGNIAKDCLSSKKQYFFIRLMGRVASHITLECALQTHPNLAFISEEIASREMTLVDVVREVADLVEERHNHGRHYGVFLIPEGIIEQMSDVRQLVTELNDLLAKAEIVLEKRLAHLKKHISKPSRECLEALPDKIQEQLVVDRDPHGNVQVSKIETAQLLALLVTTELAHRAVHKKRHVSFSYQTVFCGYEGRSAFPSNFDCTYCYALGRLAAVLAFHRQTGVMTALRKLHCEPSTWEPVAVPLASLLHFERRGGSSKPVIKKTLVDVSGDLFRRFTERRGSWRLSDEYIQPPPMQFFGSDEFVFTPCLSIMSEPQPS